MCGYQVLASGVGIRGGHQVWASSFFSAVAGGGIRSASWRELVRSHRAMACGDGMFYYSG